MVFTLTVTIRLKIGQKCTLSTYSIGSHMRCFEIQKVLKSIYFFKLLQSYKMSGQLYLKLVPHS